MIESTESRLPAEVLDRATVSAGGEYAWRPSDVPAVIEAGRECELACLGGQVQWQFSDGTCEAYWLNYDSADRKSGEPWAAYVKRSCSEVLDQFARLMATTDWVAEAAGWKFLREKASEGVDVNEHRRCVLYFASFDEQANTSALRGTRAPR